MPDKKLFALKGDVDVFPWIHWAAAFGSGKAHQLLAVGILVEVAPEIPGCPKPDLSFMEVVR